MSAAWHAATTLLARYAAGDLDDPQASSLEAHLLGCELCRAQLRPLVPSDRLDHGWEKVVSVLDAPRVGWIEGALLRLGVRDHVARLLAATPSLRFSWFLAEAFALGSAAYAAAATSGTRGAGAWLFVFLVLAALAPTAGVAVAFGPGIDPAYEIGVAAPLRGDRLLFIRATAVLAASLSIGSLAALALPGFDRTVALWLLPAFCLTAATLTLATWMPPVKAACTVALGWLGIVAVVSVVRADPLAGFDTGGQLAYLVVAVTSLVVLSHRRPAYRGRILT